MSADGLTRTDSNRFHRQRRQRSDPDRRDRGQWRRQPHRDRHRNEQRRLYARSDRNGHQRQRAQHRTTSTDSAGNGVFNLSAPPQSSIMPTAAPRPPRPITANNGTMLDQTVTTVSAGGLTTTTQSRSHRQRRVQSDRSGRHRYRCLRQPHRGPSPIQAPMVRFTRRRSTSIMPMA